MDFEEKFFSSKRITYLSVMLAATFGAVIALCIISDTGLDVMISLLCLTIIFFVILVLGLFSKRRRGLLSHPQVCYGKLCFAYIISVLMLAGFFFMPSFTRPMILVSFLIYLFSQESIAVYVSVYFSILICMIGKGSIYELASLVLICSLSVFLITLIREKKHQIYVSFSLMALNILIPCLFYYLEYGELELSVFAIGCIGSVVTCLVALFLYVPIRKYVSHEEEAILDVIIMKNYALVRDIYAYSIKEYNHAVKVMTLAAKCAIAAGADEKVCAAGGFYYRLGFMEGEPYIENGVRLALDKGFPESVVRILAEYGGEERPISSVESAIVHMVDSVVTRLETIGKDAAGGSFNQHVVIYQTLNEISSDGFYDKSSLTMNQYLKTRDVLANEEDML